MTKRSGLGKNLSVLLGKPEEQVEENETRQIDELAINQINPGQYQPRRDFDEAALMELSESIKKQGLLQPLVVRKLMPDNYEIIAGERRWRASKMAGLTRIPVVIRQVDDETAMAIALVENLQREDLNAMDQARAIQRLTQEFDLTHGQVAQLLSKSRASVSNFLRLLQLGSEVKRLLEHGDIEMGHARCLLMLTDAQQQQVARLIVAKSLSVRETEALVQRVKSGQKAEESAFNFDYEKFENKVYGLAKQYNTKVKLKPRKDGKGSLVFDYSNEKELEVLLQGLQHS